MDANQQGKLQQEQQWAPIYSRWRHGGWYVSNLHYPSGACGCVSNNYPDGKWRIACDDRRSELGGQGDFTFPTRDAAARAEYSLVQSLKLQRDQEVALKTAMQGIHDALQSRWKKAGSPVHSTEQCLWELERYIA